MAKTAHQTFRLTPGQLRRFRAYARRSGVEQTELIKRFIRALPGRRSLATQVVVKVT